MRRRFNYYSYSPWFKKIKGACAQFIIPLCLFQGFRTLLLPSVFDVLLLVALIGAAIAINFEMI